MGVEQTPLQSDAGRWVIIEKRKLSDIRECDPVGDLTNITKLNLVRLTYFFQPAGHLIRTQQTDVITKIADDCFVYEIHM